MKQKKTYSRNIYTLSCKFSAGEYKQPYISHLTSCNFYDYKKTQKAEFKKEKFYRTKKQINQMLLDLEKEAETEGQHKIIYIYDLNVLFDYFVKNIPFFKSNFDNKKALFKNPRDPIYISILNLEFRSGRQLLRYELKDVINFEIESDKLYYQFSKIPPKEFKSVENLNRTTLCAILRELNKWEYIKHTKDIPLTATALIKKQSIFNCENRIVKEWLKITNRQKKYTKKYIEFLEKVNKGGMCFFDLQYFGKPLKNVISFDEKSSYIFQMIFRKYPNFFIEYTGKFKTDFLKDMFKINSETFEEKMQFVNQPNKYAFLAKVKLKNVKPKDINGKTILTMNLAKVIQNPRKNLKEINERVYTADFLTLYTNDIDLWIDSQFYNFEIADCEKLYYTKKYLFLPDFVQKNAADLLSEKETAKALLKKTKISKQDFFNERKKEYICNDFEIDKILNEKNAEKKYRFLLEIVDTKKRSLNALYGFNIQKLKPDLTLYQKSKDLFIEKDDGKDNTTFYSDYEKGIYISAYARLHFVIYILFILHTASNVNIIYGDTDCWKLGGDTYELKALTEAFNNLLTQYSHNNTMYNIGNFEIDGEYNNFISLGFKKYMFENGEKVKAVVSGVNSFELNKILNQIYCEFGKNFKMLCENCFTVNTIFDKSLENINKYYKFSKERTKQKVTDLNGESGIFNDIAAVQMIDCDFNLFDLDNLMNLSKFYKAQKIQKSIIDRTKKTIYNTEKGLKISYDY